MIQQQPIKKVKSQKIKNIRQIIPKIKIKKIWQKVTTIQSKNKVILTSLVFDCSFVFLFMCNFKRTCAFLFHGCISHCKIIISTDALMLTKNAHKHYYQSF